MPTKTSYVLHIIKSGMTEEISEEIAEQYEKEYSDYSWDHCHNFLKTWLNNQVVKVLDSNLFLNLSDEKGLIKGCIEMGLSKKYAEHFVCSGVITSLTSLRDHILIQFLRTAYNGSTHSDIKSIE